MIYKNDIEVVGIYDRLKELFEILDKENKVIIYKGKLSEIIKQMKNDIEVKKR